MPGTPVPHKALKSSQGLRLTPRNNWVRQQGIEPWTYGLKAPSGPEQSQELNPSCGAPHPKYIARAKTILAAIEARDPIAYDLMVGLARELVAAGDDADRRPEGAAEETATAIGPDWQPL